ncbi:MAG: hypothetical protein UT53_C0007G0015 [Candidatus Yanofskybacteria bacterium GW2011_GWD2_39_48]|uniref:DUF5666 domain-containing protein n=1 Tax=Candidatus Yanofskybacteria bacterium GW2011_GWD2_39_48 TaxID=1619031 RepID=A0A0G0SDR1_9BACT|nr:MAG: hypothetical protein UT53_C0007G0015 [Candidatus Yanofskybacteria bacterium GW2011_GWD2_39_48]
MRNKYIVFAIIAIVGLGLGFFSGMKYSQSRSLLANIGQGQQRGQFGNNMAGSARGGINGMSFINGDILSMDTASITVKLKDGGSKIILFPSTVEIGKFTNGTVADLVIGKTVTITGKTNTDGSITAQTIQIRPAMPSPSPTMAK